MNKLISFIIIGLNIENTINRCVDGVLEFVKYNRLINYEIIYVDSNSKDKTIDLALKYPISIIKLYGVVNAAVGRNEGARFANGEVLFFIDGDMEIYPNFYDVAFKDESSLHSPFCSGVFINYYYDNKFKFLRNENYAESSNCSKNGNYSIISGGLFLIEREKWEQIGGMDNRFDRNQDIDFGIRMARNKQTLFIYNKLLAKHHTIDYFENGRLKTFLRSSFLMFYGVLIRKHFFSFTFIKMLIRGRYSMFILLLSIFSYYFLLLYLIVQILRTLKNHKRNKAFINSLIYKLFTDIYCLVGTLFFYPSFKKYKVEIVKNQK